jgi:hypothetical protein
MQLLAYRSSCFIQYEGGRCFKKENRLFAPRGQCERYHNEVIGAKAFSYKRLTLTALHWKLNYPAH